ncbi:hypothetical protein QBC34DRAFT_382437 [Podospora aff. communis PSN243]|uniref:Lysine-specific metallo-endopeptidase domain-containing protein n=1 Tax=Podospora aff. communis PSN243 TaxID=3040156 RepID=A0AAV9GGA4_9PEZI|nr:hypothetical protein QBC34DRAFT_382437 [Podospora aff. communis PSN243]
MAQRWILHESCFNDDAWDKALTDSFKEAVEIAGIAAEVLENDIQDPKVQSMVGYILGDTNVAQSVNIAKGEYYFRNVAKYNKEQNTDLDLPSDITNNDLRIYCDKTPWELQGSRATLWKNGVTKYLKGEREYNIMRDCFEKRVPDPGDNLASAVTTSSNVIDKPRYLGVYETWQQGGMLGPQPDVREFSVEAPRIENTMNICMWYLTAVRNPTNRHNVFYGITDAAIANVQKPEFQERLGSSKQIDVLAETMGGLLLHELTHTNLGGLAYDDGRPSGCYGWECVKRLKNIHNSDSVKILGICMFLFRKGFWVDENGVVLGEPKPAPS